MADMDSHAKYQAKDAHRSRAPSSNAALQRHSKGGLRKDFLKSTASQRQWRSPDDQADVDATGASGSDVVPDDPLGIGSATSAPGSPPPPNSNGWQLT